MWYWQAFFAEHPKYAKNDFFITGESYAGHYIPAFASRVYRGNKNNEGIHINLKVLVFLFLQVLNLLFFSFFCYKDIIVMV
jgi:carboxypeptidase C (cathepsin A)